VSEPWIVVETHCEAQYTITLGLSITQVYIGGSWQQCCKLTSIPHFDKRDPNFMDYMEL
jgi:hypothetical protein